MSDTREYISNLDMPEKISLFKELYNELAGYGIEGDTELAHVNTFEASLLKSLGGSGTLNEITNLREYKGGGGAPPAAPPAQQTITQTSEFPTELKPFISDVLGEGQAEFQREKAEAGHYAMMEVINSGGNWDEARQTYYENAATTRVQLIDVNKNLNIQYGLADAKTQQYFDEFGKIPRTEESFPQDNFDSTISEDESHLEFVPIQPTFQTDFVKKVSDDKCAKWNAKAQKFMAKGKGVPPGIAKKVLACNNGQDWKLS